MVVFFDWIHLTNTQRGWHTSDGTPQNSLTLSEIEPVSSVVQPSGTNGLELYRGNTHGLAWEVKSLDYHYLYTERSWSILTSPHIIINVQVEFSFTTVLVYELLNLFKRVSNSSYRGFSKCLPISTYGVQNRIARRRWSKDCTSIERYSFWSITQQHPEVAD